ncbi:MAG: hypothetical protein KGY48_11475 [Wenzhouxiangellaceae bacterium]|nr:hypothetical protein [Wenzhouxiangellaceae bacterium]MBS3747630.1 hypothetical protein [Wenzhouxiangellaceae bacterium]MBS3822265.1 hypothetical protein [Wenzhouxiangellaceae bacterium]
MLPKFVRRFLERRRFPTLMLLGAVLFIANLLVPDPLPFVDEALMLIATVLIGSVRSKKKPAQASSARKRGTS